MTNGLGPDLEAPQQQQHFHHHHHEAESDADEEVRSLDLPGKTSIGSICVMKETTLLYFVSIIFYSSSWNRFAE